MGEGKIYIAGPISGQPDHNRIAFNSAAEYWEDCGWEVFNPIVSEMSIRVQQGEIMGQEAYRKCMRIDLDWICGHATAIYMLQGWEQSKGARTEHALAVTLGIAIMYQA